MQKKLIALAVASLASGAAFAQTNVTMYGVADAGYVYASGGSNSLYNTITGTSGNRTFSGIQSGILSGSRLGFKGSEALGNGLKAVFTLEYSLNIDDNSGVGATGGLNARQQFVGLSSDKLGTVALGRQYSPGFVASVNNDPTGGSIIGSQSILSVNAGNTITPNSPARWNNAVTYTSPNWSGFTGKLIYSLGESDPSAAAYSTNGVTGAYNTSLSTTDNGRFGIGGNYSNGPLNVDLVYQTRQKVTPFGPALTPDLWGKSVNEGYLGASYDFTVVKIMGSYQQQNDKNFINNDNTVWTLGAVIPVLAASNVHLSYGQLDMDAGPFGSNIDGKSNTATVAWTTNLSKRTTLYAGYIWIDNDKDSIPVRSGGVPSAVGALNETNNTFAAGVRHTF